MKRARMRTHQRTHYLPIMNLPVSTNWIRQSLHTPCRAGGGTRTRALEKTMRANIVFIELFHPSFTGQKSLKKILNHQRNADDEQDCVERSDEVIVLHRNARGSKKRVRL